MTVFLMIRHGDTDAVGNMLAGRREGFHLNTRGNRQVGRLSTMIQGVELAAVFTGPLERTVETASAIAEPQRLNPVISEALNEIATGDWTGLRFDELKEDARWRRFNTFRSGTGIPGGEYAAEVQNRVVTKMLEWVEAYPGKALALVSHADVIKAAVSYFAGIPIDFMLRLHIDPASVSIISVRDYGPEVLCINCTGDLASMLPQYF
ncbi:MAG: histidine phosphatase family protein [Desulfobacterales bacterium]